MAHSKYYDEDRNGQRNSIDDATPEEWNEAARKDRERRGLNGHVVTNRDHDYPEADISYSMTMKHERDDNWLTLGDFVSDKVTFSVSDDFAPRIEYKFREGELINELQAYIDKTYNQHYAGGKIQATEDIIDDGHGTGFCIGNAKKYLKRYGKKGETPAEWRKDIMKVLHYSLIQLYIHDLEHGNNTN